MPRIRRRGKLVDKPVSKAGDADIHDAQDAQAAPFLVLEECPNTGNVPIAESSQTLQMNEPYIGYGLLLDIPARLSD